MIDQSLQISCKEGGGGCSTSGGDAVITIELESVRSQLKTCTTERDIAVNAQRRLQVQNESLTTTNADLVNQKEELCLQVQRIKNECNTVTAKLVDVEGQFERFKNLQYVSFFQIGM